MLDYIDAEKLPPLLVDLLDKAQVRIAITDIIAFYYLSIRRIFNTLLTAVFYPSVAFSMLSSLKQSKVILPKNAI